MMNQVPASNAGILLAFFCFTAPVGDEET
jgi:hypothetical protein